MFFLYFVITLIIIILLDTKGNFFFIQERVGKNAKIFIIYKIRTIPIRSNFPSTWGKFLRFFKIDELPQIYNICKGEMALVGPRPDVPGYADLLQGEDRIILTVKPGITGLASLKYRNEEYMLAQHKNPLKYNDEVIWPDKVRINKWYIENKNVSLDLIILFYTFIPLKFNVDTFINNYKNKN